MGDVGLPRVSSCRGFLTSLRIVLVVVLWFSRRRSLEMIRKSNIQLTCYLTLDLQRLRHERAHCSAFELRLKDASRSSSINSPAAAGLCCADCSKMALDGQRCRLECRAVVVVLNRMLINLYCLGLFD